MPGTSSLTFIAADVVISEMQSNPAAAGRVLIFRRLLRNNGVHFIPRQPGARWLIPENNKEAVMKRSTQISLFAALAVMLFAGLLVTYPAAAQARAATAVEGAKFDTGSSIKDNLKIYIGKDVVIHLRSGKSIQGYVKTVGDHLIHME